MENIFALEDNRVLYLFVLIHCPFVKRWWVVLEGFCVWWILPNIHAVYMQLSKALQKAVQENQKRVHSK